MTNQKAPRVAELSEKFCIKGHKGDWIARASTGTTYCASCARDAQLKHKFKQLGLGSEYVVKTRERVVPMLTKQEVEERWARGVLATASAQMAQAHSRLKELAEMVQQAHEVVQKSTDEELLGYALEQMREISRIFDEVLK